MTEVNPGIIIADQKTGKRPAGRWSCAVWVTVCLLLSLLFLMPAAGQAEGNGGAVQMTAEAADDSLVARVFARMLNDAAERPEMAEGEEWEDPSLAEYPLIPRELKDYGASPRVRLLVEDEEDRAIILRAMADGTLDEVLAREPNYLVYREDFYLVSPEDAKQYELTWSEDRCRATLRPGISLSELSGKRGIVLLGENLSEDEILVFDGQPTEENGSLSLSLADPDQLKINHLFCDGNLAIAEEDVTVQQNVMGGGMMIAAASPVKGRTREGLRAEALGFSNPLSATIKSPSGAWTAKFSNIAPDWSNCSVSPDVNVLKLRFNLKVRLAIKADFDITSTKACGRESVEIVSIPVKLPYGFSLSFTYKLVAAFDGTPVHVAGKMGTAVSVSFGLTPGYVSDYRNPVTIKTFEVGDGSGRWYKNPEKYANKEINMYLGSTLSGSVQFLKVSFKVWFVNINFGPLVDLTLQFDAGAEIDARWEYGEDPAEASRTAESVHTCVRNGKDGCVTIHSVEKGGYEITIGIDLYFKSWRFHIYGSGEETLESRAYYNSLTFGSGVQEGVCPHKYYRVPVYVYTENDNGTESPISDYTVYASELADVDENLKGYTQHETDSQGNAVIYLPYAAGTRYTIMAQKMDNSDAPRGSARQPSDMKASGNDLVRVKIWDKGQKSVRVKAVWDADVDQQDIPEMVGVSLERLRGNEWVKLDRAELRPTTTFFWSVTFYLRELQEWDAAAQKWVPIRYRFRIENNESVVSEGGYMDSAVEAYMARNGEVVPQHVTRYKVHYEENENQTEVTITNTAILEVDLHKAWVNVPEEDRPANVYVALLSRPKKGWMKQLSSTEKTGVYDEYLPVTAPLSGDTLTLGDLIRSNALEMNVQELPEQPMALLELNTGNKWSGNLVIKKYQNGIPCDYMAAELNAAIISSHLWNRFQIYAPVTMPHFDNYISIPGQALPLYSDYQMTGTAINVLPKEEIDDAEKHTIGGVKYWDKADPPSSVDKSTLKVKLNVYEIQADGSRKLVTQTPLEVLYPQNVTGMWELYGSPWTLTGKDIDPEKEYVVEEVPQNGQPAFLDQFIPISYGKNLFNAWVGYSRNKTTVRVHKVWPGDNNVGHQKATVTLSENGTVLATKNVDAFEDPSDLVYSRNGITLSNIQHFSVSEENTSGLPYVPVISGPAVKADVTGITYVYTVLNMLQGNDRYEVTKYWYPGSRGGNNLPEVTVSILRDGEQYSSLTFKNPPYADDDQMWYQIQTIELPRMYSNGTPIHYSFEEQPFDEMLTDGETEGFQPSIESRRTQVQYGIWSNHRVLVFNRWVTRDADDLVDVTGTVNWVEESELERFRPDSVQIEVMNNQFEVVRSLTVTKDNNWQWKVENLPGKDQDGKLINYYVVQSQAEGYTTSYEWEYNTYTQTWNNYQNGDWINYNESTHTWTCDVTNTLTGYVTLPVEKVISGKVPEGESPEAFSFEIRSLKPELSVRKETDAAGNETYVYEWTVTDERDPESPEALTNPIRISGAGTGNFEFLFNQEGIYYYALREISGTNKKYQYDSTEWILTVTVLRNSEGKLVRTIYAQHREDTGDTTVAAVFPALPGSASEATSGRTGSSAVEKVTFTNVYRRVLTVSKEWDIDLEKLDRPDSIQAAIQRKKGEQWETVQVVELSSENNWTLECSVSPASSETVDTSEYRVRELKDEGGIIAQMKRLVKEYGGQAEAKFNDWITQLKSTAQGNEYFSKLPQEVQTAANQGIDKAAEVLGVTKDKVYETLLGYLNRYSASNRIIYGADDADNPEKGDGYQAQVVYQVPAYTSALSGEVSAHKTKYYVSYSADTEKDEYGIKNLAVLDVDVIKRWIHIGEGEHPDSAWVVLMFSFDTENMDKAEELAGAAGLDISGLKELELPAFSLLKNSIFHSGLLKGGINPITLIGELTIGVNPDVFGIADNLLTIAVKKVDEGSHWTASFVHTKYMMGVPIKFKGAELTSEILRQAVKYLLKIDFPFSFNLLEKYISIPTPALPTFNNFNMDSLDISALTELGKTLFNDNKAGLLEEMRTLVLDETHLAANVINVQIKTDPNPDDDPGKISGRKYWLNDQEADRPTSLTIKLKKGSTLVKSFEISKANDWKWEYQLQNGEKSSDFSIEEEYPADYDSNKIAQYTTTTVGFDVFNTWDAVTIAGQKTWVDGNNKDGLRPEKLRIHLLIDGHRVTDSEGKEKYVVETTAASGWRWVFPNMPKNHTYSVEEEMIYASSGTHTGPNGEKYKTETSGYNITNTIVYNISGKKIWNDSSNADGNRPASIYLRLMNGSTEAATLTVTKPEGSATNEWPFTFQGVPKYDADGHQIQYTVTEDSVPCYTTEINGMIITNTPEKTSVKVTKVWDDNNNQDGTRPTKITIHLLADGTEKASYTVNKGTDGSWNDYTFENLPQYKNGREIHYTVREDAVADYYTTFEKITGGYRVINKHEPATTAVTVYKVWLDDNNRDGIRPQSITLRLLADGVEKGSATVTADSDGNWMHTFTNLPKNHNVGTAINYTIREDAVSGYTTTYYQEGNFWVFVNEHTPEEVTVSGQKTWDDDNNHDGLRPDSITVNLLRDGTKIASKTVTADAYGKWKWEFENLYKYRDQGTKIKYTITEESVPLYNTPLYTTSTENEYIINITNTHENVMVNLTGFKLWLDDENQDGKRPESITIRLYKNGQPMGEQYTKTVTANENWSWNFGALPYFDQGTRIDYSVREDPVDGYETYSGGMNVLNIHIPERIHIEGKKTWNDADNQDGKRPESITVYLMRDNNTILAKCIATAKNGWSWDFGEWDKYENGQIVNYTIKEDPVPTGYTDVVNGYDITNTHTPETITVTVEKAWEDANNQDGKRPEAIELCLLADGEEIRRETIRANESGLWQWTVTGLPRYKAGKEIDYTVRETEIPGYTASYDGPVKSEGQFKWTVTNTHIPSKISIRGEKYWVDDNNRDRIRPASITIHLLQDGRDIASRIVTAQDNWRWDFGEHPEYENGRLIDYTVREDAVSHYSAYVLWYDVLNYYPPQQTSLSGEKTWEDGDNASGLRPERITVRLYADGTEVEDQTVTAENNWKWEFRNLFKNAEGKEIQYTVAEDPVNRYEGEVDGYNLINRLRTGIYTVETYYQENGVYPDAPNTRETRNGTIGATVQVTNEDMNPARERYSLDQTADNVFSGVVTMDGGLVLKLYFRPGYFITYDPNGGTVEGSREPISFEHFYGEEIRIHSAAVRPGYVFDYWRGSAYQPGDSYTVTGDHTFVAQWQKEDPLSYHFTFTKKWSGKTGDSISWTLYNPDGTVRRKKFDKTVVSDIEWQYDAWFETGADYYLIEDVPEGYLVRYENVGLHEGETDRCYNGGTIINYTVPNTGDPLPLGEILLAGGLAVFAGTALTFALRRRRRKG